MEYEWERDLVPHASPDKIEKLRSLVDNKIRKGLRIKISIIAGDLVFITLLFVFIFAMNISVKEIDLKIGLINGIIAFELAIITFLSPIKIVSIEPKEVDKTLGKKVTIDIMGKIGNSLDSKTSNTEKWLAFIGAFGIFISVILKFVS